ncbi:putative sulfate exporter family transporter [Pseudomonas sp. F1_0610]|uniref:YeiH family protein n=1 Tax=Pseudomonas sp. F1_0610 TaxID=3114284 RepID=UPI0039C305C6
MLKIADFPKVQHRLLVLLPGILCALVVAVLAYELSQWQFLKSNGIGLLTLSVLLGLVLGNLMPRSLRYVFERGFIFCKNPVLRFGVALYGLRLSLTQVAGVGVSAVAVDAAIMFTTMLSTVLLARYVFKMDREGALVIGAGHAVCGAAAILACSGVIRARDSQVAIAIACVVLFGTATMLLYPWLYQLQLPFFSDPHTFGIFTGATVHEVAQVVAVGNSLGDAVMEAAVVTKLIRVLLLAPFIFFLGAWLARQDTAENDQPRQGVKIPVFVLGFILCLLVNSFLPLPSDIQHMVLQADEILLATAMAALGLGTSVIALKEAGLKPLLLALLLTLQLIVLGALFTSFL